MSALTWEVLIFAVIITVQLTQLICSTPDFRDMKAELLSLEQANPARQ